MIAPARGTGTSPPRAVLEVPRARIRPMPDQPREYFGRAELEALAESLAERGQAVPVLVYPLHGDRRHDYELIDGQRRWHAAEMAGLDMLRVEVIDEPDPERRFALAVVANMQRVAHHPLEIAQACRRLRRTLSLQQTAQTLGHTVSYVQRYMALLDLHPDLAERLHPGTPAACRISVDLAVQLAKYPRHEQLAALQQINAAAGPAAKTGWQALAALAAARPRPSHGKTRPGDPFVDLLCRVRRTAADLERVDAVAVARRARRRPADEARELREQVARLSRAVQKIAGSLDGEAAP